MTNSPDSAIRIGGDALSHTISRVFPLDEIRWFATVSGDPNPVHIDAEFASRIYPGAVVAHGAHLVLWALETLPMEDTTALADGLTAVFLKPAIAGDEVQAEAAQGGAVRLQANGQTIAKIKLKAGRMPDRWPGSASAQPPSHPPVIQSGPTAPGDVSGALLLPDSADALLAGFPNLGERFGPRVLQGLAGMATVSGAVLGGMTTEFSVAFSDDEPGENLEYRLLSYRPAIRRFELAFQGYGLIGKVAAISGESPGGAQPGLSAAKQTEADADPSEVRMGRS